MLVLTHHTLHFDHIKMKSSLHIEAHIACNLRKFIAPSSIQLDKSSGCSKESKRLSYSRILSYLKAWTHP